MTDPMRMRLLLGALGVLLLAIALRVAGMVMGPPEEDPEAAAPPPAALPGVGAVPPATPYGPTAAERGAARRARRAGEAAAAANEVVDLDLQLLDRQARSYHPGRDPWRFGEPPPPPAPPAPPPPTPAELARMRAEEERLAQMRAAEAERLRQEALIPKPPPFTMKYLGSFGPPNRRLAVFSDGHDIYNARQGEVLQGRFIVARIGYESVDIQFVGFPNQAALRLGVGR